MKRDLPLADLTALQADADLGNRDPGDDDPIDTPRQANIVWHPSFLAARAPRLPEAEPTEAGRRALQEALQLVRREKPVEQQARRSAWCATPAGLRRILAKAAGLDETVANKIDMQLSEQEKAALRAAALHLKTLVSGVVEL